MARSAIPDFGKEYPEYEYRPWPKHVGFDELGDQVAANNQEEYDRLLPTVAFPKVLGKDKNGNEVIANTPRDGEWLKDKVVPEKSESTSNALTSRPGRPAREA